MPKTSRVGPLLLIHAPASGKRWRNVKACPGANSTNTPTASHRHQLPADRRFDTPAFAGLLKRHDKTVNMTSVQFCRICAH
jgi:hypothetical protein